MLSDTTDSLRKIRMIVTAQSTTPPHQALMRRLCSGFSISQQSLATSYMLSSDRMTGRHKGSIKNRDIDRNVNSNANAPYVW